MNKLSKVRREHGLGASREGKRSPEKKKAHKFGDFQFDYLQKCKHDLTPTRDPSLCPFCKLVAQQLNTFFEKERQEKAKARHESVIRRAHMRYTLLQSWSKNQPLYFHDLFPAQMTSLSLVELSFSSAFVESLAAEAEAREEETNKTGKMHSSPFIDMQAMTKVLNRRRRILEVGIYAAVYLQSRIRKWCTRRRVRHMLLRRFEYIPPETGKFGRPKREFFVDTMHGSQQWPTYPRIIASERPNTPRTIARRLAGISRRMDANLAKYNIFMKKYIVDGAFSDLWSKETSYMYRMRNFVAFVDLVQAGMTAILRLKVNEAERQGLPIPTTQPSFWVTLSAPAPPSRQFGLALAVDTPNYRSSHPPIQRKEYQSVRPPAVPVKEKGKTAASKKDSKSVGQNASTLSLTSSEVNAAAAVVEESDNIVPYIEMNASLQALELRAWKCLQCNSPLDLLSKLLNSEIHPPMVSCIHIARDEHCTWHGFSQTSQQLKKDEEEFKAANPGKTSKKFELPSDEHRADVLPMTLQLRSVNEDRGPASVFRLFFFEGEFVAATQAATWVLYPEILRDKDNIVASLLAFTESSDVKMFVCSYFARANREAVIARAKAAAAKAGSSYTPPPDLNAASSSYSSEGKLTTRPHQTCVPFYIPTESTLYEMESYFGNAKLTAEETVALSKQYKFLSKVPAFKPLLIKAQNAVMRSKRISHPTARSTMPQAGDPRAKDVPAEDDLLGTGLYKELCINAPGGHLRKAEQYAERLRSHALLTDGAMQSRVVLPEILSHDHGGLISLEPTRFDLLAIEVTIAPLIGKNKDEEKSATSSEATKDRRRAVDIHAVVGLASCDSPRPPPHLDCGLVDWSIFQNKRQEQERLQENGKDPVWMRPSFQWTQAAQQGIKPLWGTPDQNSGVMQSRNLKTASAKEIVISIIGGLPSKDYLVSEVPRKVQRWLNWQ